MKEDTYCEFDKITQPEMCGFGALFEYLNSGDQKPIEWKCLI